MKWVNRVVAVVLTLGLTACEADITQVSYLTSYMETDTLLTIVLEDDVDLWLPPGASMETVPRGTRLRHVGATPAGMVFAPVDTVVAVKTVDGAHESQLVLNRGKITHLYLPRRQAIIELWFVTDLPEGRGFRREGRAPPRL